MVESFIIRFGKWIVFFLILFITITSLYFFSPWSTFSPLNIFNAPQAKKSELNRLNYASLELHAYVPNLLKKMFIPADLKIENKVTSDGKKTNNINVYGVYWERQSTTFFASLIYEASSSAQQKKEVLITQPHSDESANNIILHYFNSPDLSKIHCIIASTITICESFVKNDKSSVGNGIIEGVIDAKQKKDIIFSCYIPSSSSLYKNKSCIENYALRGL